MTKYEHRVALITGGSQGIGKEITTQLANSGIITCIAAKTEAKINQTVDEINAAGGEAHGFVADVSEISDIDQMITEITSNIGEIDILINNAGIGTGGQQLWEEDIDSWWKVMEVNLKGPVALCNRVLPSMVERDHGVVINMSSFAAIRSTPMTSSYGISKTALTRLSDTLAAGLSDTNVAVFPISPGLVYTEMTKDIPVFQDLPDSAWTDVEEAGKLVLKLISGTYHRLSGRFIHVSYDLDDMLSNAEQINEKNVYKLRLAKLSELEE